MRINEPSHQNGLTLASSSPPAMLDETLSAYAEANRLRNIWLDLQAPASAARRDYEVAVGVVRALLTDTTDQVAA